jgi:hypothetical protein
MYQINMYHVFMSRVDNLSNQTKIRLSLSLHSRILLNSLILLQRCFRLQAHVTKL